MAINLQEICLREIYRDPGGLSLQYEIILALAAATASVAVMTQWGRSAESPGQEDRRASERVEPADIGQEK